MEIDQIETFLAVVTYGGFHRAAVALRVSQPAVSARVRALEDSLGVDPFNTTEAVEFPVTFGDFVRLYERFAK